MMDLEDIVGIILGVFLYIGISLFVAFCTIGASMLIHKLMITLWGLSIDDTLYWTFTGLITLAAVISIPIVALKVED